jgi:hypothetical protein
MRKRDKSVLTFFLPRPFQRSINGPSLWLHPCAYILLSMRLTHLSAT